MSVNVRWWNIGILLISLVLLVLWASRLVNDAEAFFQACALKKARRDEINRLRVQREAARTYVRKLTSDPETIEQLIRGMGYARANETMYVIPRPPKPATPTNQSPKGKLSSPSKP